jgi:hypothetical protein
MCTKAGEKKRNFNFYLYAWKIHLTVNCFSFVYDEVIFIQLIFNDETHSISSDNKNNKKVIIEKVRLPHEANNKMKINRISRLCTKKN